MVKTQINTALLAIIGLVLATSGSAWAAGNADTVIGEVNVLNRDGQLRVVSKGSRIVEGESVITGPGAEILITTDDSGVLAVRPLSRRSRCSGECRPRRMGWSAECRRRG